MSRCKLPTIFFLVSMFIAGPMQASIFTNENELFTHPNPATEAEPDNNDYYFITWPYERCKELLAQFWNAEEDEEDGYYTMFLLLQMLK